MGARSDVKKLKSPAVNRSGAAIAVRLISDVKAPWIFPCSDGGTAPAPSPWMVGCATPATDPSTMMTSTTHPADARP